MSNRVAVNTSARVNQTFRHDLESRLAYYAEHPMEIESRLEELRQEWDVERVLETNASILALTGTLLGLFSHRKFLLLPVTVLGFLLQHALQGWCPPLPVIRQLGYRTQQEIDAEWYGLKALRGDFRDVKDGKGAVSAMGDMGSSTAAI